MNQTGVCNSTLSPHSKTASISKAGIPITSPHQANFPAFATGFVTKRVEMAVSRTTGTSALSKLKHILNGRLRGPTVTSSRTLGLLKPGNRCKNRAKDINTHTPSHPVFRARVLSTPRFDDYISCDNGLNEYHCRKFNELIYHTKTRCHRKNQKSQISVESKCRQRGRKQIPHKW